MEHFAGIDVPLEQSSVCVVDAAGKIIREAEAASESRDPVRFFRELGVRVTRVGLKAGLLSQRLHTEVTAGALTYAAACFALDVAGSRAAVRVAAGRLTREPGRP